MPHSSAPILCYCLLVFYLSSTLGPYTLATTSFPTSLEWQQPDNQGSPFGHQPHKWAYKHTVT